MPAPPLRLAVASGVLGGGFAALVLVLPPLLTRGGDGTVPEYLAILVTLLAVHVGGRAATTARPDSGFGARVGYVVVAALVASAIATAALYGLYAGWRPGLLEARYALHAAPTAPGGVGVADLTAHRAQSLDPAFQALSGGGRLLFCGLLFGAYGAFRWRVARRLGRRPSGA